MKSHFLISVGENTLKVKAMRTDEERSKGYQHSKSPPTKRDGMIFMFEDEKPRAFHMRNVPFSLGLLGFNADGELVCKLTMSPSSPKVYSTPPCKFVIEASPDFCNSLPSEDKCFLKILRST